MSCVELAKLAIYQQSSAGRWEYLQSDFHGWLPNDVLTQVIAGSAGQLKTSQWCIQAPLLPALCLYNKDFHIIMVRCQSLRPCSGSCASSEL